MGQSSASDFLTFRKMLTPVIIQVIFWIGVAICVIGGIGSIATGTTNSDGGIIVLYGVLSILVGPLFVRIYCELLVVIFRINETLTDIKKKLDSEEEQ